MAFGIIGNIYNLNTKVGSYKPWKILGKASRKMIWFQSSLGNRKGNLTDLQEK